MEQLWDSSLYFHVTSTSETIKILIQRAKKIKVIWCQDPTQPGRWYPCCSNLDGASWTSTIQPWLCTMWLPSSGPSEEVNLWSQMPNLHGSGRSCLTVVPFAKPRILCWRHSFTDNTLTNAWTFRLTMRESRSLFSSLLRNVILNKKCSISKYSQKKVLPEKVSYYLAGKYMA